MAQRLRRPPPDGVDPSEWRPIGPDPYTERNALGNLVSGQLYIPGNAVTCILHRVNREARQAALRFYYLKLPIVTAEDLATGGWQPPAVGDLAPGSAQKSGKRTGSMLLINPEWDYIQLQTVNDTFCDVLDGLYDLRAYDRKGTGLRNWVLSEHLCETLSRVWPAQSSARRQRVGCKYCVCVCRPASPEIFAILLGEESLR